MELLCKHGEQREDCLDCAEEDRVIYDMVLEQEKRWKEVIGHLKTKWRLFWGLDKSQNP